MAQENQEKTGLTQKLEQISKRLDQIRTGATAPRAAVYTATGDHFSVVVTTSDEEKSPAR